METFTKLFARFLGFVYHCFDRIVIQGYLPLLTRPEHVVHFFRDVHGLYPITPEVLAKRTNQYRGWVGGYIRNHEIPVMKAEKGMSKEECVRPHLRRMERRNQHGVCSPCPSRLPERSWKPICGDAASPTCMASTACASIHAATIVPRQTRRPKSGRR